MPRVRNSHTWTREQAIAMIDVRRARLAERLTQRRKDADFALPTNGKPSYETAFHDRIRALTGSVTSRLEEEACKSRVDGQKLNWLASALERLAELERILAGRPLPGSRRPPPQDAPASKQPPTPPAPMPVSAPPITRTIPSATPPPNIPTYPTPQTPLLSDPPDW